MNEISHRTSLTPTFALSTRTSSPTRPGSPIKRISAVGDSNCFLTALAAQERRVLELREELKKAEDDLSRLKKQWATHEAIKKRNEFRHREQLQKLGPASRSSYEGLPMRDESPIALNPYDTSPTRSKRTEQEEQLGEEQTADLHISTRQTQRRIFAGSRHTRALSLLSKIDTTKTDLVLQRPCPQAPHLSQKGNPLKRSQTMTTRKSAHSTINQKASDGQPKEVFMETGKQLVGDLREGLWTFFEDLRQATVGEEASTDPNRTLRASVETANDATSQGRRQESNGYILEPLAKDRLGISNTSSETPTISTPAQRQPTRQITSKDKRKAEINKSPCVLLKQAMVSDDEDPWDTWDSPVVTHPAPGGHAESTTSDSVTSSSTRRESPRSSLSSLDAAFAAPRTDMLIEKPTEIPWPALSKLSPSNLKMTASTLMNEWEKSITHSSALDPTGAMSKTQKAE
ncbi:MAG: hypothetical protein Q9180_000424 [Flavoplaca navasiana]